MKRYNSNTTIPYDLSKIMIPVNLIVGTADKLGDVENAKKINENLINSKRVGYYEFNLGHASFLWGRDMSYMNEIQNHYKSLKYIIILYSI